MISLLLENAASIEAKDLADRILLAWAIKSGSEKTVRLLLKRGSVIDYWYKLISLLISWICKNFR